MNEVKTKKLSYKELKPCFVCGGAIAPIFYRVILDQFLINPKAVNEFMGMHQVFDMKASHELTALFSPQSDRMAESPTTVEHLICQNCAMETPVMMLWKSEEEAEPESKVKKLESTAPDCESP